MSTLSDKISEARTLLHGSNEGVTVEALACLMQNGVEGEDAERLRSYVGSVLQTTGRASLLADYESQTEGLYPLRCGSRYEETRGMPLTEINKLIRAEIKRAKKAGILPRKARISVRKTRDGSLGIYIRSWPTNTINPAWAASKLDDPHGIELRRRPPRHAPDVRAALEYLERYARSFNRSRTNSMVDYFDERFYLTCEVDYKLTYSDGEKRMERLQEERQQQGGDVTEQPESSDEPVEVEEIEVVESITEATADDWQDFWGSSGAR